MNKLLPPLILVMVIMSACSSPPAETSAPEATSPPSVEVAPTDEPPSPTQPPATEEATMPPEPFLITLTSPDIVEGQRIPTKFTCDGEDISPELNWTDPPEGTQSLVLIMDDPDAPNGTWVHWVLYNIPPETRSLPENIPAEPTLSDGSLHGKNSWGRLDYGGPCPPSSTHRYFFKLYALDTVLDDFPYFYLLEEHMLAEAQLMGVYSR